MHHQTHKPDTSSLLSLSSFPQQSEDASDNDYNVSKAVGAYNNFSEGCSSVSLESMSCPHDFSFFISIASWKSVGQRGIDPKDLKLSYLR